MAGTHLMVSCQSPLHCKEAQEAATMCMGLTAVLGTKHMSKVLLKDSLNM